MFDAPTEGLPKVKNWYKEGAVSAPNDQH
jgi:C1A family cysteine protease